MSAHLDLCMSSVTQKISQNRLRIVTFRPENRHVILGGENLRAKGCCIVSTFIARVSRMAIRMVCRDVKVTLQAY